MSFLNLIKISPQSFQAPSQPSSQQQQKQLHIEEDVDIQLLQEREQAIRKIESDIVEVNQIFKDLASIVHDQGEVIDSIEANIESTNIQIHEGNEQLAKASDYSVSISCPFNLSIFKLKILFFPYRDEHEKRK